MARGAARTGGSRRRPHSAWLVAHLRASREGLVAAAEQSPRLVRQHCRHGDCAWTTGDLVCTA